MGGFIMSKIHLYMNELIIIIKVNSYIHLYILPHTTIINFNLHNYNKSKHLNDRGRTSISGLAISNQNGGNCRKSELFAG